MKTTKKGPGKVVQLHPLKAKKASVEKWGEGAMSLGFCIIPSLLLKAQARLNLNAKHLAILVHLADFWWEAERKPHPSKATIGKRIGMSPRHVQRHIAELEAMGLLKRIERRAASHGKRSNFYDLGGLVARLNELAPELREIEDKAKEARERASRPGLKQRAATAAAD